MMRIGLYYRDVYKPGGYPDDVRSLSAALTKDGHEVEVFDSPRQLVFLGARKQDQALDILHIFGLWIPSSLAALLTLLPLRNLPVVVSFLGQATPFLISKRPAAGHTFLSAYSFLIRHRPRTYMHWLSSFEREPFPDLPGFIATLGMENRNDFDQSNPPRENGFLFFGRNDVHQKGLDLLVEGFASVRSDLGHDASLTIAGRSWEDSAEVLSQLAHTHGVADAVHLIGNQPSDGIISRYRYFVYPSRFDGPPRPLRAAVAAGTPVLITTGTNMGDIVEQSGVGLVTDISAAGIGRGMVRLSSKSAHEWDKMSNTILQLQPRLSWETVAQDYTAGYRSCLEGLVGPDPLYWCGQ